MRLFGHQGAEGDPDRRGLAARLRGIAADRDARREAERAAGIGAGIWAGIEDSVQDGARADVGDGDGDGNGVRDGFGGHSPEIPHPPIVATYDPRLPAEAGPDEASGAEPHPPRALPDPAASPAGPGAPVSPAGPGASVSPAGPGASVSPAGPGVAAAPAARPTARLISRPDGRDGSGGPVAPGGQGGPVGQGGPGGQDGPVGPDAPLRAAPAAPARRRIWDLEGSDAPPRGDAPAAPPDRTSPAVAAPDLPRDAAPSRAEVDLARAHLARIGAGPALPGRGEGPRAGAGPDAPTGAAAGAGAGAGAGWRGEARPDTARARTRVLGFHGRDLAGTDPDAPVPPAATRAGPRWPVGWIVVAAGPGRGASFSLVAGVSSIGRGADQAIALDFGDLAISRENHAAIVYDDRDDRFLLGHGGKANIVRLNGRPVVSTEEMSDGDEIAIGDTVLRFVALCGGGFRWGDGAGPGGSPAAGEAGHG